MQTGGNDNLFSRQERVRCEKISDVVGSDSYKINNKLDDKYKPHAGPDIVKKALKMVGQELPYHLIVGNCEHFATWLRYGDAKSQQVSRLHPLYHNAIP